MDTEIFTACSCCQLHINLYYLDVICLHCNAQCLAHPSDLEQSLIDTAHALGYCKLSVMMAVKQRKIQPGKAQA